MGGLKRPEILAVGCGLGFMFAYFAGSWVDDALGRNGTSLIIAEIVTAVVMPAFVIPALILARRSGER